MPIKLIKPSKKYAEQVMKYKEEMLANNDSFDGCARLEDCTNFDEWVNFEDRLKKCYGDDYVPSDVYLAINEDDELVGIMDYRHYLSPFLFHYGGHIGYSVRPSKRRMGYAKDMLKELLKLLKNENIDKVLVTCDRDNEASRKTIINNGGILDNEVVDDADISKCGIIQRYWIKIN